MVGRTSKRSRRAHAESSHPQNLVAVTNANILVNEGLATLASDIPNSHPESLIPTADFSADQFDYLLASHEYPNPFIGDGFETQLSPTYDDIGAADTITSPDADIHGRNREFEVDELWVPRFSQSIVSSILPSSKSPSLSIFTPSFSQTPAWTPSRRSQDPSPITDDIKAQFPHIGALCKIISVLEAHLRAKSSAIDEVMRVNKACMTDIMRIRAMEEYKMCKSCGMLVSTALDLIMSLYEGGISEGVQAPSRNPLFRAPQQESALPSLQFGVFQLDRDEQINFSNRIISKELQRSIQLIRTLAAC